MGDAPDQLDPSLPERGAAGDWENGWRPRLVRLIVVFSILGFIVMLSAPDMLRSMLEARENATMSTLRTVSDAEEAFRYAVLKDQDEDGLGEYGTLTELAGMGRVEVSPAFIDPQLGLGSAFGYRFVAYLGGSESNCASGLTGTDASEVYYYLTACPVLYGRSGRRSFVVDASGVMRGSDVGGAEATCLDFTGSAPHWHIGS